MYYNIIVGVAIWFGGKLHIQLPERGKTQT
ncbi:hypothetical protein M2132_001276 [Dysgonomonas sp. PH5-45]|nr:hypothetical protein [Dysgonomonas sp. PH5-45]MDH6387840.1 hypothetical protein [Dysgonomonas sp. PH5-37]